MYKPLFAAFVAGALFAAVAPANADDAKTKAEAAKVTAHDRGCVRQTNTRIPASGKDCLQAGRSYTHEQITATGATTAADALRLLDPAIRVR